MNQCFIMMNCNLSILFSVLLLGVRTGSGVRAQVVPHPAMQEGLGNDIQGPTGGGRTRDCGPAGDSVLVPLSCRIIRARGRGDVGGHRGSSCQDPGPPHLPPSPHVSSDSGRGALGRAGVTRLSAEPKPWILTSQTQGWQEQEGCWVRTPYRQSSRMPCQSSAQGGRCLQWSGGSVEPDLLSPTSLSSPPPGRKQGAGSAAHWA